MERFRQLHEAGIIAAQLAERLKRMASFRKLLVHMYRKVDYNCVCHVL
ncbi:HepT-like ribonuclease domain-containing protein [Pelomicrobium sp. G1]